MSPFGLRLEAGRPVRLAASEVDLDRALGRVDAGAHDLARGAGDGPRPQIAHLTGAKAPDAAVADAHAAAEGHRGARALAGDEDRLRPVAGRLDPARAERDRAAAALGGTVDQGVGLEVLVVQAGRVAVGFEARFDRRQQARWPAHERLALAPVGADLVEL